MMDLPCSRLQQQRRLQPAYTEEAIVDFDFADNGAHVSTQSSPTTTMEDSATTPTTTAAAPSAATLRLVTTGSLIGIAVALSGIYKIDTSSSASFSFFPEQFAHFSGTGTNFAFFATIWSLTTAVIAYLICSETAISEGFLLLSDDNVLVAAHAAAEQKKTKNHNYFVWCIFVALCTAYGVRDAALHVLLRSVLLTVLAMTVFLLVIVVITMDHNCSSSSSNKNDYRCRNQCTQLPTFLLPKAAEKSRVQARPAQWHRPNFLS